MAVEQLTIIVSIRRWVQPAVKWIARPVAFVHYPTARRLVYWFVRKGTYFPPSPKGEAGAK